LIYSPDTTNAYLKCCFSLVTDMVFRNVVHQNGYSTDYEKGEVTFYGQTRTTP